MNDCITESTAEEDALGMAAKDHPNDEIRTLIDVVFRFRRSFPIDDPKPVRELEDAIAASLFDPSGEYRSADLHVVVFGLHNVLEQYRKRGITLDALPVSEDPIKSG